MTMPRVRGAARSMAEQAAIRPADPLPQAVTSSAGLTVPSRLPSRRPDAHCGIQDFLDGDTDGFLHGDGEGFRYATAHLHA